MKIIIQKRKQGMVNLWLNLEDGYRTSYAGKVLLRVVLRLLFELVKHIEASCDVSLN